jgi:pimeloyl-ACP methyl ester carboxylesterase
MLTAQSLRQERIIRAAVDMVPRLVRHPVWRQVDPDQGAGRGVLLIPGFGVGDRSLTMVRNWLRARGYRPAGARIGVNVGCTTELVRRLERRLIEHAETTGGPVVLLGQSRGGWLGRIVAVRRPTLVSGLVMLGSPVLDPLGAHPKVVRVAQFLAWLAGLGVPGLLDRDCLAGICYRENFATLSSSLPPAVPALAVYSRVDGVVPWQLCLDPSAECVEVRSSHVGMGLDPDFYTVLGPRLAAWAADPASRLRRPAATAAATVISKISSSL